MKSLTITNFQAHANRHIEFDPHITTIVGASDVGKSAILRSLIWALTNKPSGDAFIRDGEDFCEVELEVDDENTVTRFRGKSENTYTLNGAVFKAFGNDVPEEISNLLNIKSVNIQSQHDSPWWFSETNGEISRQLNSIVDLSVIDRTLNNLDSLNRQTQAEKKVLQRQQKEAQIKLESYSWLRKAHETMEGIENQYVTWQKVAQDGSGLTNGVQAVQSITEQIKNTRKAYSDVLILVQSGEKLVETEKQNKTLFGLIESAEKLEQKTNQPIPDVDPLFHLWAAVEKIKNEKEHLEDNIFTIVNLTKEVKEISQNSDIQQKLFKEQLGDTCPLCQSKLSQ